MSPSRLNWLALQSCCQSDEPAILLARQERVENGLYPCALLEFLAELICCTSLLFPSLSLSRLHILFRRQLLTCALCHPS